jgi:Tn3 transposase DDE domain
MGERLDRKLIEANWDDVQRVIAAFRNRVVDPSLILRKLGTTPRQGATRSEALPHVPTVGDFVAGYEANAWQGLGAPRNSAPPRDSAAFRDAGRQNGHAVRWSAEGHKLFIAEPCRHRLASDIAGKTKRLPGIKLRHVFTLIYFAG